MTMLVTSTTPSLLTGLAGPRNRTLSSSTAETFRPLPESARDTRPSQADTLLNAFVFASSKVPQVDQLTGLNGALRLNAQGRLLTENFKNSPLPIISELGNRSRSSEIQIEILEEIRDRLGFLRQQVSLLRNDSAFNTRSVKTDSDDLTVLAGSESALENTTLTATQTARGEILVSDPQNNSSALGLSGRFLINGVGITVETTDGLSDIVNKINRGEDTNGNARLDAAEDINGNGEIDIIQIPNDENGKGVFIIEDVNGNGQLDSAEDSNLNKRLNGGVAETGVAAGIQNNRLVLASLNGGDTTINLQDEDGVLLALGFFELNAKGNPIQKEVQLDFGRNPVVDLNQSPQLAQLETETETLTSPTNRFTDAIEDAVVDVNEASGTATTVSVFFEAEQAVSQIETLFNAFNRALVSINQALKDDAPFGEDLELQSVRTRITEQPQKRFLEAEERNQNIENLLPNQINPQATGITTLNREKDSVNALSVTQAIATLRKGLPLPSNSLGNQLFQKLSQVGIQSENDDTFSINSKTLKQGFETNRDEVLDLLTNEETGLLPILESELSGLLRDSFGTLEFKIDSTRAVSDISSDAGDRFRRVVENTVLEENIRTLIAVA